MRPSRHQMYMAMARAAAMRATCYRLNVGAILVDRREQNVVAMGYNGAISGEPHCTGNGCRYFTPHGCLVVHAERNALNRLKGDWPIRSLSLYVTHSPCGNCAQAIVACGTVAEVWYETAYRDFSPIQGLLQPANGQPGLRVLQLLPSGLAVDQSTGQLVDLE